MRILEKVLYLFILLALMSKLTIGIPGGSIFLVFGILGLSVLYFHFSLFLFNEISLKDIFKKGSYQNLSGVSIVYIILCGMSFLAPIMIGILFKIQSWPLASMNLAVGIISGIVFIGLGLFLKKLRNSSFLWRGIPICLVGILFFFISEEKWIEYTRPEYLTVYQAEKALTTGTQEEWNEKVSWIWNKTHFPFEGITEHFEVNGDTLAIARNQNYFSITNFNGDSIVSPHPKHKEFYFLKNVLGREDIIVTYYSKHQISQFIDSADYFVFNPESNSYEKHPLIYSEPVSLITGPEDQDSLFFCSSDFINQEEKEIHSTLFKHAENGIIEFQGLRADFRECSSMLDTINIKGTLSKSYDAYPLDLTKDQKKMICQNKILSDERYQLFWKSYLKEISGK